MTSLTPRWRPTPHRSRLLTIAIVTLVLAYAVGRPELIALAAPLLVLAVATRRPPRRIDVTASTDSPRCFEDDEVALTVRVQLSERVEQISAGVRRTATMATAPHGAQVATRAAVATFRWTVTPARWGRYRLGPLPLTVVAPGAAVAATLHVTGPELTVYPRPMHAGAVPLPTTLPRRPGDHPARVAGTGMEFVGVRPYAPGDRLRHVNWSASTKRGELYVNELADERSADLVAVIDAMSEVGEPPNTSLDRAVRGAAGLAQTYLRRGDRAGVVALGGMLRWLRPGLGQRQLYELIDAVLDVRFDHSFVDPDIDRLPRAALPPGALVVLFSPLLDSRVIEVVRDLRARGYPLVVADVLAEEPGPSLVVDSDLAVRLWRLERRVTLDSLTEVGAVVVDATGTEPLDVALAPLRRMAIPGGAR